MKLRQGIFRFALLPLLVLLLPGCYYLQLARGQLRILNGRKTIPRALREIDLTEKERAQLELVPSLLAFARDRLSLYTAGLYKTFYDAGNGPVVWSVSACDKASFDPHIWKFPFIGDAPYKGFFELDDARAEAVRLSKLDLDVRVSEVPAYSTLGWFNDPVFRSMLHTDRYTFINTLLHELAHATVYSSNHATFNESLATFIGNEGALSFLQELGADVKEIEAVQIQQHDGALVRAFVDDLFIRLSTVYEGTLTRPEKLEQRTEVFTQARKRFALLRKERFKGNGYAGFEQLQPNNCVILAYRTYHTDQETFTDVHHLTGKDWSATLQVFEAAKDAEDPLRYLTEWRHRMWRARTTSQSRAPLQA